MNDVELIGILKSARVREPSPEYWEQFPQEIIRRLRTESIERISNKRRAPVIVGLRWAGFAAVCLVVILSIELRRGHRDELDKGLLAESANVIREVTALFPNRVRAIVSDASGTRLVLADEANVPKSAPLLVKVCEGTKCETIITFSGQEILVANKRFEVLADVSGNVLLVGDRQVWSSADAKRSLANLKVAAKAIEVVL